MSLIKLNKNIKTKKTENYDFCFICYEIKITNEKKPMKLKTQQYYIKNCSCDGLIHKHCLDTWYSKTKNCPICRHDICDVETFLKTILLINITKNDTNNDRDDNEDDVNDRDVNVRDNNDGERSTIMYLFYIIKSKYKIKKVFFTFCIVFCIYNFYISIINHSYDKYKK